MGHYDDNPEHWESLIHVSGGARPRCRCGKARYATEKEAGRAVKRMRYRGRGRSYEGLLHPYMCPERKGIWHVGHTDE